MISSVSFRKSIAVLGLLLAGSSLLGQYSNVMYHMKSVPQSLSLNPAKQFRCDFYLGFPGLNSVFTNYGNNSFDLYDLVFPGTGEQADSLITILHPSYNIDDFINKIKISSLQSVDANISLFTMGFRAKKSYISFDLSTKVAGRVALPKDLLAIVLKGNGDYIGQEANFSPLRVNATAYHEFSIGISRQLSPKLTFGFRPKFLLGVANVTTASPVPNVGLYTDPDNFDLTFHSRLEVNVSAPIDVYTNADGGIDSIVPKEIESGDIVKNVLNFKNPGMGLDLGAEYQLTDKLILSASLIDLGFIRWGSNTYNFKQDGEFLFTGFDLSKGMVENSTWNFDDEAKALWDSVKALFDVTNQADAYFTFLAPKLYVGASYDVNRMIRLGFLSRTEYYGSKLRQSVSLSANFLLAGFMNVSAAYNIMNQSYDNLGIGFSIKGGPFQFYVITDKIPIQFTKIKAATGDFKDLDGWILPSELNSINVRFGLNLIFGCRHKKLLDKPMLMETTL
jgi:hypothetical protein